MPKGVKKSAEAKPAKPAEKALFPNDSGPSQKEIVFEILNGGVTKPAEIEQIAIDKYKTTISKGNINQIKMKWKAEQGATPTASKPASTPAAPTVQKSAPKSDSMSPIDAITATLELVKAVGVAKAESILKALGNGTRSDV